MKGKVLTIGLLAVIILLRIANPVSALTLDYYYFETDQSTYQVGDTINMVTKLLADFSIDGHCYISFAITTDQGVVFNEGFYIPASPEIRYISASYTILPEDTIPNPDPVRASVFMSVEIEDGYYYQGASDTIYVNLTRGQVDVASLTPLSIESNTNHTLSFRVASKANESIPYVGENIAFELTDSEGTNYSSSESVTSSEGICSISWNPVLFPSGDYTLTVSGNGNNAFLPFTKNFTLFIQPEHSSLIPIKTVDTIYCQTPSGLSFENHEFIVQHVTDDLAPIMGSNVTWVSSFDNGTLDYVDEGRYQGYISFKVSPGMYQLNITARNVDYQTADYSLPVNVLPRNTSISILSKQALETNTLGIDIVLKDQWTDELLQAIPIQVDFSLNDWNFTIQGISNSTGQLSIEIQIPFGKWGVGSINISTSSSVYYASAFELTTLSIKFLPDIILNESPSFIRGYNQSLNVTVTNPLGNPLEGLSLQILDSNGSFVANAISDSFGMAHFRWMIALDAPVGHYLYSINALPNIMYAAETSIDFTTNITYPLWFIRTGDSFVRNRASNLNITFLSEMGLTNQIAVRFQSASANIDELGVFDLGIVSSISFYVSSTVDVGEYTIDLSILSGNFTLLQSQIGIYVRYPLSSQISNASAFFQQSLTFDLDVQDDWNNSVNLVDIRVIFYDTSMLICKFQQINPNSTLSIMLPDWVPFGRQEFNIQINSTYSTLLQIRLNLTVWIKTEIQFSIYPVLDGQTIVQSEITQSPTHDAEIASMISFGSISNPPPIFCNGTTSAAPLTTRDTSVINCPRFNSGTINRSTVSENSRIISSGNGHTVRNLRDLNESLLSIIASSTDRDVLPKETTPHSAFSGPLTTTSERKVF